MADKDDSGNKTELPTQKRIDDARKKGDVAKSKDLGSAFVTICWLILIALGSGYIVTEIVELTRLSVRYATEMPFTIAMNEVFSQSIWVLIKISLMTLLPIALIATFIEFAQIGPITTTEKLKPSLDKMNPVEGLKRMFGKDGLVELVKNVLKALLVVMIMWVVLKGAVGESLGLMSMAQWSPVSGNGAVIAEAAATTTYNLTLQVFGLIVVGFIFVAILDRIYTKHSFIKKMMMSREDIKKEHKENEGDPHIKGARKQMHEEWANSNAVGSAGSATALLVNPTHISIAIDYDAKDAPVPVIAAKGEGPLAAAMRAEAERAGVPIIRNVVTARKLWATGDVGDIVPEEMFDAIAELILWAKKARDGQAPMWNDMDAGKPDILFDKELAA
jgi:type III secretion protein U